MDQREAVANLLMEHCKNEAAEKVEKCLESGDSYSWRDILRYEFDTETLIETSLRYDIILPKLILYEIRTISPFHYAALIGNRDILMSFLDKDLPVDLALKSGSTALHLACFSGNPTIVKLLVDVYKADLNKQDNYGWSALHYASTQGQIEVVQILLDHNIDVNLRDKDGTSAAFRAQVNGHENVVSAICEKGDEDELMNIYERVGGPEPEIPNLPNPNDVYAVPSKGKFATVKQPATRSQSVGGPDMRQGGPAVEDEHALYSRTLPAPNRMPRDIQLDALRDVIQSVVNDDSYMRPESVVGGGRPADTRFSNIGRNTLRGVIKEELDKFRRQMFPTQELTTVVPAPKPDLGNTYEDLYASISHFGPAPSPPQTPSTPGAASISSEAGPPLPPRNTPQTPTIPPNNNNGAQTDMNQVLHLKSFDSNNAAMVESFKQLAPRLGSDWKKLAVELPIDNSKSKTADRIKAIEKKYPGDPEKQATAALVEWNMNKRQEADIDSLILALRRSKLNHIIEVVEKVTQEFTA